jgi:glucokinase
MSIAAETGNALALACFERTAEWLALGLANAVCSTGPARIVLFGGIARSGAPLLRPLLAYFDRYLLNIYRDRVDLVLSALPEDDAALLGAAALSTAE